MKNFRNIFLLGLILFSSLHTLGQHQELYSEELYINGGDTLRYRMLLPKNFVETDTYPLMLFLHGAGERGNDNIKQLIHGSELFVTQRDSFPAIIIFPQCPINDFWANAVVDRSSKPITLNFTLDNKPTKSLALVMSLMDDMITKAYVNSDRIYVGGLSMGGMGTFEILYRKPNMFAAAFAICGAGNPDATEKYALTVPMWIFHGANDDVVNPQSSVEMVGGLLKYGGKPNFSLYANDNHNSWDSAFAEPELLPWLFSNSKFKQ